MNRRQFLATLGTGTLTLAGCTGSTTDPDATPTPRPDEPLAPVEGTWSTYQFDAARTGYNPTTGRSHEDRSGHWLADIKQSGEGLAFRGGTVYVGGVDGMLWALDARTGAEQWSTLLFGSDDDDARWRTMTISDGTLFAGSHLELYALDVESHEERWTVEYDRESYGGETVVEDTVVVAKTSGTTLAGLDAATGNVTWNFDTGNAGIVTNLASDGTHTYFMTNDGTVHALDVQTGEESWQTTPEAAWSVDDVAVADGRVFLTSGTFWALDAEAGDQVWELDIDDRTTERSLLPIGRASANGGPQASAPAIAGGTVYAKTFDERGVAIDAASGRVDWSVDLGPGYRPPVVTGDAVYLADGNVVRAYESSTGEPTSREFEAIASVDSFVVVDGVVFSTSGEGYLQALTGTNES